MQLSVSLQNYAQTSANSVDSEKLYQQLKNLPNSIISLQYNPEKFLSFKVYEVNLKAIVFHKFQATTLQCQIRGATYTFTDEHLDQMTNRELNDLFNYLGINKP